MLRRRSDLPLQKDPATRYLPWLVGFMVFLAILAAAGVLVLGELATRWDSGISGTLTVQVPAAETVKGAPTDAKGLARLSAKRLDKVTAQLKLEKTVQHFEVLSPAKVGKLLEPWVGQGALPTEQL